MRSVGTVDSAQGPGRVGDARGARVARWALLAAALAAPGCGSGGGHATIVVNTLLDMAGAPPEGTVTLRRAVETASSGDRIEFDPSLDGGTILLSVVGEAHSILPGEVYSTTNGQFQGYVDRDYGRSALYARKDLAIDASSLPSGITVAWDAGAGRARVLAVRGRLTMRGVAVTGGYAEAEAIADAQAFTLARGGGLAVFGTATLSRCTIAGNTADGRPDTGHPRDRGVYGGGIYANGLVLDECVIAGNLAVGYGAAGGGLYSVGGADATTGIGNDAYLTRCAIGGNRVTAQHAYGGGIFSLSGGPLNLATMHLANCTIAMNLVEANTPEPPPLAEQFYYRGGGVYMGGGSIEIASCTIAQNEVRGHPATFGSSRKPNMGGGGFAATIGNAHVVEDLFLRHSVLVGNSLNGAPSDLYSGSLLYFSSQGHNRIGALDFSQILVPIPPWQSLSRKHYPKAGDLDGTGAVRPEDALDLAGAARHPWARSAGVGAGELVVLWYPPGPLCRDAVPAAPYSVSSVLGQYELSEGGTDDFLVRALDRVRAYYGDDSIGTEIPAAELAATFSETSQSWPSDPLNRDWIAFWRDLDADLDESRGTVRLGDDFWNSMFSPGWLGPDLLLELWETTSTVDLVEDDQRGLPRPTSPGALGDIGAIEE